MSDNRYSREFTKRMKSNSTLDVYDVLNAFSVTCPMIQHAVKKLLVTGNRLGGKSSLQDLDEAIWSLQESLNELVEINHRNSGIASYSQKTYL